MTKTEWAMMVQTLQRLGFQILEANMETETILLRPIQTR